MKISIMTIMNGMASPQLWQWTQTRIIMHI